MKKTLKTIIVALFPLCLASLLLWSQSLFAHPIEQQSTKSLKVVASINPFCALAAALMQSVAKPTCLLPTGASPHEYHLKPSDRQRLQEADLIFWGGPDLETFLTKPLAQGVGLTVALVNTPGLLLRPLRQSVDWAHAETSHHHGNIDMHFWLDPNNALLLIEVMLKNLVQLDAQHAEIYKKNAQQFKKQLQQVDQSIRQQLQPICHIPYIVFHDAYQYFDKHYHLNDVGAINLHPELPPSVQRLANVRKMIHDKKVYCVFSEPQFKPTLVQQLSTELGIKTATLDPVGMDASAEGYFHLLNNLSTHLYSCLAH